VRGSAGSTLESLEARPVAVDPEWATLRRWWLGGHGHGWTSVTMLRDHRGNQAHPPRRSVYGEPGYDALKEKIEALLGEPAAI
jgi:hypothetical protein